jgi:hypothetical protein
MFSKKPATVHPDQLQKLQRQVNDLGAEQCSLANRVDRLAKHYVYRVARDGDVWKAWLVEDNWNYGHSFEKPGQRFFGATKASAVKRMKTELLAGTTPSFHERP